MRNNVLHYCATDKELYDLLMSGKQRITDSVLRAIGRDRGIFYSPRDSRELLISNLSLLPYGYHELQVLLGQRESPARAEKLTSISFEGELSLDEIRQVCTEYRDAPPADERVTTHQDGTNKYVMKVAYPELDYAKTRLLQRRKREAEIEFLRGDGGTTVRLPATPRAKEIVATIKDRLEELRSGQLRAEAIELTGLNSREAKTEFFTGLISCLGGLRLENVTSIRVNSSLVPDQNEFGLDDSEDTEQQEDEAAIDAAEEMRSVVENVAIQGQSLLGSAEYQELKAKGFFTTAITWVSQQTAHPHARIEFEAAFDEPTEGKGFKYSVKGVYRFINGRYTTSLRPITKDEKANLLGLLEETARSVLAQLRIAYGANSESTSEEA